MASGGRGGHVEPDLPRTGVPGRLLYQRVTPPGAATPLDLYLFTTLTDSAAYPLAELIALYARRWQVELRYRDIKSSLAMDEFDVYSVAMFQRELEVGLLTYNLICALLTRAARQAALPRGTPQLCRLLAPNPRCLALWHPGLGGAALPRSSGLAD